MSRKWASALLLFSPAQLFLLAQLRAPRAYLRGHDLILENAQGQLKSLGAGFNPVPISEDMFLLIRGAQMGYGEESSCESPGSKNRVVVYDIIANKESIIFDKPRCCRIIGLHATCVYEHADLSPSGSILYIVSPCYVTSGCLAVINLPTGIVRYVPGAMDVFVIRGGPREGDLIYMRRLDRKPTDEDPRVADYAYIHARPDGSQVAVFSHEDLVLVGGNAPAPILRAYLRRIRGLIYVQGEWVP